ncbi:MAG TPA: hypothetical protein PKG77_14750 [Phycisphaerae bacterium]|nr:hypothetical protein [Phycisphaerae bacterium]HQL73839.1 hypothetical protein [Phycisphaerae bacterium]
MMTYRGRVKDGIVVVEGPECPPEGAQVSIRVLKGRRRKQRKPSSMYEHYKSVIGTAKGLPPDASVNHDHYLYGLPKQK